MNRLESRLQEVSSIVRAECLNCPEFRTAILKPNRYGFKIIEELTDFTLKYCTGLPDAESYADMEPLYADEARRCIPGKAFMHADAVENIMSMDGLNRIEAIEMIRP